MKDSQILNERMTFSPYPIGNYISLARHNSMLLPKPHIELFSNSLDMLMSILFSPLVNSDELKLYHKHLLAKSVYMLVKTQDVRNHNLHSNFPCQ